MEQVAQEMNETNDYDIQETSEAAEMERKITEEEEKLQESLQEERQRKEKGRETERLGALRYCMIISFDDAVAIMLLYSL